MADVSALDNAKLMERISDEFWWAIVGLDPAVKGKQRVVIQAIGDGDLNQMKSHLKDDQIQFGAFRVMGVDPKGAVVSRRAKFVFFQWVGSGVAAFKRMQASSAKSAVAGYFRGHHVALEVDDRADITEADIEKRLRHCGGAHQPDHFEFGSGAAIETFEAHSQPGAPSGVKSRPAASPTASSGAGATTSFGAKKTDAPKASPTAPAPAPVPAPAPAPVPARAPAPVAAPAPAPEPAPAPAPEPVAEPEPAPAPAPAPEPVAEPEPAPAPAPAPEPEPEVAAEAAVADAPSAEETPAEPERAATPPAETEAAPPAPVEEEQSTESKPEDAEKPAVVEPSAEGESEAAVPPPAPAEDE